MKLLKPVKSRIIQLFGSPSKESEEKGYIAHTGLDFEAKEQDVYAAHNGVVQHANGVIYVLSATTDINGIPCRFETAYAHLESFEDTKEVIKGDIIGRTGVKKGLHFSLTIYWLEYGKFKAHEKNGYNGRENPLLLFEEDQKFNYVRAVLFLLIILLSCGLIFQNRKENHIVVNKFLDQLYYYDPN